MTGWTPLGLVILLALDAWAIWKTCEATDSAGRRVAWSAIIVLLPVLGLVAWSLAGPRIEKPAMYDREPPG